MKNQKITINYTQNGYEINEITKDGLKLLDIEKDLEKAQTKKFLYEIEAGL